MANAKNAKTKTSATKGANARKANLTVSPKSTPPDVTAVLEGTTNAEAISGSVPPKPAKPAKPTPPDVTRVPVNLERILQTVKLTDLFAAMTEDQSRQAERFFIRRKAARTAEESASRGAFVPSHPARLPLSGAVIALRDNLFRLVGKDSSIHNNPAIHASVDRLAFIAVPDEVDGNFVHLDPAIEGLKRSCATIVKIVAEETKLQKTGRIS